MTCETECDHILKLYGKTDFAALHDLMRSQFNVLHNRAQVLLALCGVVITTTGFSGRLVAGTNLAAQLAIIGGMAFVLATAWVTVRGVQSIRWLSQFEGEDVRAWLLQVLAYRNRKNQAYGVSVKLFLAGLVLYVVALGLMLVFPQLYVLPPVR